MSEGDCRDRICRRQVFVNSVRNASLRDTDFMHDLLGVCRVVEFHVELHKLDLLQEPTRR